jgi:hypothetical protein
VDEERVVGLARVFTYGDGRGVREAIAGAGDEVLEDVIGIERERLIASVENAAAREVLAVKAHRDEPAVTCLCGGVNGCWHWLWQKFSWAGVATVTWMTPLVSCRGTIWSNQTRLRLGCWSLTFCRIDRQTFGSTGGCSATRRLVDSRGEGEWVVSMSTFQFKLRVSQESEKLR